MNEQVNLFRWSGLPDDSKRYAWLEGAAALISVASPDIGPLERQYVMEAVDSGWVSSIGPFVERFEREFARYCHATDGVSTSNGTTALFITLRAMDIGPGDEVIIPALCYAAVAAVVHHVGAVPVLVDIDPYTWCIDHTLLSAARTERTRAIIAVHNYGHPADMGPILEFARSHDLRLIEDCAEAHGARYRGTTVGAIGDAGCFSFYGNKILTTGEGGMVVTNDGVLAERIRFLKDHAMSAERRYFHTEAGYNFRMTNLQAALGCAQLERVDELLESRRTVMAAYRQHLGAKFDLNPSADWAEPVVWLVCLLQLSPQAARLLRKDLRDNGVDTRPFFFPLADLPPYRNARVIGSDGARATVSERIASCGLNLPTGYGLDAAVIQRICQYVLESVGACE